MNDYLFGLKGLTVPNAILMSGLVICAVTVIVAIILDKFHLVKNDSLESVYIFAGVVFWGFFIVYALIECSGKVVVIG